MTTDHITSPRDPAQTDLIRYFDVVDHFTVETNARHDRSALMGEMIGEGVAWLWQRVTHFGETKSPPASCHVDRVQF